MTEYVDPAEYYRYIHEHTGKIQSNHVTHQFLISKCCGYSFMITVYKEQSIEDIYKYIQYEMQNEGFNKLYIKCPYNKKHLINRDSTSINHFLCKNREILRPHYPIPAPIVYRIWLDDGHHNDNECINCIDT